MESKPIVALSVFQDEDGKVYGSTLSESSTSSIKLDSTKKEPPAKKCCKH